ncbi:MAG: hypothetical protein IPM92_12720 [Saprospiraceae bacterium]|nr:hypothetical protein [Saprospiraceae bacterium]
MVTVSAYAVRQNQDGESFVVLILQGDLEIVQSQTGSFYANAKKCSISSTFSEQVAATLVGKQIPGRIIKQNCEPYDFVAPETGEIIELNYRWAYSPDETPSKVKADVNTFSKNGSLVEA